MTSNSDNESFPTTVANMLRFLQTQETSTDTPTQKLEGPPPSNRPGSRMLALLIGINSYPVLTDEKGWGPLSGALNDVEAMKKILMDPLGVPEANITCLTEANATRDKIKEEIAALGGKVKHFGDPILIYYAGHGAEVRAPDNWPSGGADMKIQMLAPYDSIQGSENTPESSARKRFRGIADITLGRLLVKLAEKAGNNITVILDSCHSTSGTRGEDDGGISRGVEVSTNIEIDYDLPDDYTPPKPDGRGGGTISKFLESGLDSHVILSACGHSEEAKEYNSRGRFTYALEKLLAKKGMVDTLTYQEIPGLLGFPIQLNVQRPQCEGRNRDRIIFDGKIARQQALYPVSVEYTSTGKATYKLRCGEGNGVTNGAKFAIYKDTTLSEQLGIVEVIETQTFESKAILAPNYNPFTLPGDWGYALKAKGGQPPDVRAFVPLEKRLLPVWREIFEAMDDPSKNGDVIVQFVDDKDLADVVLSVTDDDFVQFSFARRKKGGAVSESRYILLPQRVKIDGERVCKILYRTAHFYHHLHHTTKDSKLTLKNRVSLSCQRLAKAPEKATIPEDDDDDTDAPPGIADFMDLVKPQYNPIGNNLIDSKTKTLIVDSNGTEDEDPGRGNHYWFQVNNWWNIKLYASMFFFDYDDLSIKEAFGHGKSNHKSIPDYSIEKPTRVKTEDGKLVDVPATLGVGFGSGSDIPWRFTIPEGRTTSEGVWKLVVSTEPLDMSVVAQKSPFTPADLPKHTPQLAIPDNDLDISRSRGEAPQNLFYWDTIIIDMTIQDKVE